MHFINIRVRILGENDYLQFRGGAKMPNIKSAIKRTRVIGTKTLRNKKIRSACKTAIRTFVETVDAGDKAKAEEAFKIAVKKIDQACSKGVIKDNTASRKKSALAKKLNTIK